MSKFINKQKTRIKLNILKCYSSLPSPDEILFVGGSNNKIINTWVVNMYDISYANRNDMYNYIKIYNSEVNIFFDAMRNVNINNSKMHQDFDLAKSNVYTNVMINMNLTPNQHTKSYGAQFINSKSSLSYDNILMKVKLS